MHLILLGLGLLIGGYALYRFFMKANIEQIKALFLVIASLTLVIALFYMAVTGRLPAAIALVGALIPFVLGYLRSRQSTQSTQDTQARGDISTREEALEILGLQDGADEKEIQAAYKKLMQKVHPDAEGSEWMAAKLNAARDLLLEKKDKKP